MEATASMRLPSKERPNWLGWRRIEGERGRERESEGERGREREREQGRRGRKRSGEKHMEKEGIHAGREEYVDEESKGQRARE
eukprot:6209426-Pleurochrysis_carterae.AAC.3